MRVIAGSAGGLRLNTLDGIKTRPTADRVKEALFSSLSDKLISSSVFDAFAGSGALGIEALSRGASNCVFCENDRDAYNICVENLKKTHLEGKGKIVFSDAISYIKNSNEKFDIIFLDPPYSSGLYELFLTTAYKNLSPGGLIIAEYEEKNAPNIPCMYNIFKKKRYGRVNLVYLSGGDKTEDSNNSGEF